MQIELFLIEDNGHWQAQTVSEPLCVAVGISPEDACKRLYATVLRVIADKTERNEDAPHLIEFTDAP
jgi:predicted RNase H-like HicB family nuclease